MRFMVLVKATEESEAGALPRRGELEAMGAFNDELVKAGVLLDADGLQASSKGARIVFSDGKPSVVDGPFPEKDLVSGYWMIRVKDKAEAVSWMSRAPFLHHTIELRQVFEMEDFGPELGTELRQKEERQRAQAAQNR